MMKCVSRFLIVVLGLCLLLAGSSWAATVGKIAGQVKDASGKPLPGVSLALQGTRLGAVSDADGYYVILYVEPGTYTLKASIIGYESVIDKNVQVSSDRTAERNFSLKETTVAGAEVVVQAQRPLVEVDQTTTEAKISMKDVQATPILRSVNEHIRYVAGVDPVAGDAQGVKIRRTTGYTTSHWQTWTLDGMELSLLDTGFQSPRQYSNVPVSSIGEIGVIRGGAQASQASSPSGVVNIVTREGTRDYQGMVDYRAELPMQRHRGPNVYDATPGVRGGTNGIFKDNLKFNDAAWVAETDATGRQIHMKQDYVEGIGSLSEGWLTGPLGQNATFLVNGKYSRLKQSTPAARRLSEPQWTFLGKLTFTPTQNLKAKLLYNESHEPNWGTGDRRGVNTNLFLSRGFTGYLEQWNNRILMATVTHTLSPKTYYEFQAGFLGTNIDSTVGRTDPITNGSWQSKDKSGYFNVDRLNRANLRMDYTRHFNFRFDFNSQVSRRNLMKVGFSHQIFNNRSFQYQQGSESAASIYVTAEKSDPNKRFLLHRFAGYAEDKLEFQGFVMNAGLRYDVMFGGPQKTLGSWMKIMPAYKTYNAYQTRTPLGRTPAMQSFSPRVGVSHPITAKSMLRFDYGSYYKPMVFGGIYTEGWNQTNVKAHPNLDGTWADEPWAPGGGWTMDGGYKNPAGGITHTTQFEVAGDWNFISDFVLDLTTYYNRTDNVNGAATRTFYNPGGQIGNGYISAQAPSARFETKGLEMTLFKPLSQNFSFRASVEVGWNFYRISGGGIHDLYFYPDSSFVAGPAYQLTDANDNARPLTLAEIQSLGNKANNTLRAAIKAGEQRNDQSVTTAPVLFSTYPGLTDAQRSDPNIQGLYYRMYWLAYQIVFAGLESQPTTQASFQFVWNTPSNWGPGPKVGGSKILGGLQTNLVWRFNSGTAIQTTPPGKAQIIIKPGPMFVRADLNIQKTFEAGRMKPTLYAEIFNVFNSFVDQTGGDPYIRWGLKTPTPNNADYLKYGDSSPFRGGLPRYVNLGMRMSF
ncbi:MAG: TonB-dependent receptor [Candidatus Latescibacteria bacterium]|nr:TonB-dependent receptor [Candidatus Latescibacterota bacterium]